MPLVLICTQSDLEAELAGTPLWRADIERHVASRVEEAPKRMDMPASLTTTYCSARAAALTGQNERSVFEVLLQREKLGAAAVGYGVASSAGKLPKLEKSFGLFARSNGRSISRR